jgi:ribosome-associated translation inhibitor RaiA
MRLTIQARHVVLTDALKEHIKRRLDFALGTRYDQIQRINVTLSDINGPRGGRDKRCQMLINIAGQPDIMINDVQVVLSDAIDRAASRASRTVTKRISRQRIRYTRISTVPNPFDDSEYEYENAIGQ